MVSFYSGRTRREWTTTTGVNVPIHLIKITLYVLLAGAFIIIQFNTEELSATATTSTTSSTEPSADVYYDHYDHRQMSTFVEKMHDDAEGNGTTTATHERNFIQDRMNFNDSNSTTNNMKGRLEFVHITKTGGSAIEKAGATHGVIWGACHYMWLEEVGCKTPDIPYTVPAYQSFVFTSPWHTPPKVLASYADDVMHPYMDANLFAVIRNPYDRIVSEYYCPWTGAKVIEEEQRHNATKMNLWVQDMITRLDKQITVFNSESFKDGLSDDNAPEDKEEEAEVLEKEEEIIGRRLLAQKHFINQAEYVFDGDIQIVNEIIHYEHLQKEFDALMKKYDLDVSLPSKEDDGVYARHTSDTKLTLKDLDEESLKLINDYAKDDFYMFGYEMVDKFEDGIDYNKDARGRKRV